MRDKGTIELCSDNEDRNTILDKLSPRSKRYPRVIPIHDPQLRMPVFRNESKSLSDQSSLRLGYHSVILVYHSRQKNGYL